MFRSVRVVRLETYQVAVIIRSVSDRILWIIAVSDLLAHPQIAISRTRMGFMIDLYRSVVLRFDGSLRAGGSNPVEDQFPSLQETHHHGHVYEPEEVQAGLLCRCWAPASVLASSLPGESSSEDCTLPTLDCGLPTPNCSLKLPDSDPPQTHNSLTDSN